MRDITIIGVRGFEALSETTALPGLGKTLAWFDTARIESADPGATVCLERYGSGELVADLTVSFKRDGNGCLSFRWAELTLYKPDSFRKLSTQRPEGVGRLCRVVRKLFWRDKH